MLPLILCVQKWQNKENMCFKNFQLSAILRGLFKRFKKIVLSMFEDKETCVLSIFSSLFIWQKGPFLNAVFSKTAHHLPSFKMV